MAGPRTYRGVSPWSPNLESVSFWPLNSVWVSYIFIQPDMEAGVNLYPFG